MSGGAAVGGTVGSGVIAATAIGGRVIRRLGRAVNSMAVVGEADGDGVANE